VFLIGAAFLDRNVYDRIREASPARQTMRLAEGGKASSLPARALARRLIGDVPDLAVDRAVQIKEGYLDQLGASPAINAFHWCKARLALEHPDALGIVQRFEADSKFFRSLLVVLVFTIPAALLTDREVLAAAAAVLLPFAFWRFVEQRVKATNHAYWFIITIEAAMAEPRPMRPPRSPDS
jgi:hypothetical protein